MKSASAGSANDSANIFNDDTIRVDGKRVRLCDIDAPEVDQDCHADGQPYQAGDLTALVLTTLIGDDPVRCDVLDTDRDGRAVARSSVDGMGHGSMMVAAGWVWDYTRYSNGFYVTEEARARGRRPRDMGRAVVAARLLK